MGKNVIQRVEIASRLQRGLHLKDSSPAPHLADVVVPVILVEDMSRIDDSIQLTDQRPFFATSTMAAVAGNLSSVQLVNPQHADSKMDVLAVLDRIIVNASGGANYRGQVMAAVGGSVTGFNRDMRYVPLQGSICVTEFSNAVAPPSGTQGFESPAAANVHDDLGIVIPAGFMFALWNTLANSGLMVTFFWREFTLTTK